MTTLTPAARKLGEQPAFPVQWEYAQNGSGMTYRQWLIGQAATAWTVPEEAIEYADMVLNRMAELAAEEQP